MHAGPILTSNHRGRLSLWDPKTKITGRLGETQHSAPYRPDWLTVPRPCYVELSVQSVKRRHKKAVDLLFPGAIYPSIKRKAVRLSGAKEKKAKGVATAPNANVGGLLGHRQLNSSQQVRRRHCMHICNPVNSRSAVGTI